MSGPLAGEAVYVTPPVEGFIWRFAAETSTKAYVVPTAWHGKYIVWEAAGAGSVQFGVDANVSVTDTQDSTRAGAGSSGDPYTLTVHDASGWEFAANKPVVWYVPAHLTHFAVIVDAAGDVQVMEAS